MFILHELGQMGDKKERENLFATVNGKIDPRNMVGEIKLSDFSKVKQIELLSKEEDDNVDFPDDVQFLDEISSSEDLLDGNYIHPSGSSYQLLQQKETSPCLNGSSNLSLEDQVEQKLREGDGISLKDNANCVDRHEKNTSCTKNNRKEITGYRRAGKMTQVSKEVVTGKTKENGANEEDFVKENHLLESLVDSKKCQPTENFLETSIGKRNAHINRSMRLILNVGGTLYETFENTLAAHPDTLLGDPERRLRFYNPSIDQYVFKRHIISFDAILFYYQSKGILSKPQYIDQTAFEEELEFFEITSKRGSRSRFVNRRWQKPLRSISLRRTPRRMLHNVFNRPFSSTLSSVISFLTIFVTLVATVVFCIETLPRFRQPHGTHLETNARSTVATQNKHRKVLVVIEIVCIGFVTSDYLIRLSIARGRLRFIISHLGIIDLMTLVPFYLSLALSSPNNPKQLQNFVALLRQLRILQVFRLARYSYGFRALLHTVSKSLLHLGSFIFVIPVMSMFFASVSYFAEDNFHDDCIHSCKKLQSISDWFWYSVITITTVGYGDVYPRTILGKLVGAICALFGVILFCLLTPIIFRHFVENYYVRELMSQNISAEKRKLAEKVREMYYEQYEVL
ncbi:potassium voltage-gated channel subfamily A member 7-like isoform X2 [Rhopilema esculentum]